MFLMCSNLSIVYHNRFNLVIVFLFVFVFVLLFIYRLGFLSLLVLALSLGWVLSYVATPMNGFGSLGVWVGMSVGAAVFSASMWILVYNLNWSEEKDMAVYRRRVDSAYFAIVDITSSSSSTTATSSSSSSSGGVHSQVEPHSLQGRSKSKSSSQSSSMNPMQDSVTKVFGQLASGVTAVAAGLTRTRAKDSDNESLEELGEYDCCDSPDDSDHSGSQQSSNEHYPPD